MSSSSSKLVGCHVIDYPLTDIKQNGKKKKCNPHKNASQLKGFHLSNSFVGLCTGGFVWFGLVWFNLSNSSVTEQLYAKNITFVSVASYRQHLVFGREINKRWTEKGKKLKEK